jgi:glutamyl-tRNA reductase
MSGPFVKSDVWRHGSLLVVGISHHTTSLEVRERLVVSTAAWRDLSAVTMPTVLLSTCNRIEVYAWASGRGLRCAGQIRQGLARATNIPLPELAPHLVYVQGHEAMVHLVRVAAGLDSLIIGEDQILGQVRRAFREALASRPMPAPLMGIFERALQAARCVRAESPLAGHPSIATARVDFALSPPELRDRPCHTLRVLVVGAGVMPRSALAHVTALGVPVTLLNRTVAHAHQLAQRQGATVTVAGLEALPVHLEQADLVVCGTERPVLDRATLRSALGTRPTCPLVVLDLGVPRNVEPSVRSEPGMRLVDLDDLEHLCPLNRDTRAAEQERLESRAVEEARSIDAWLHLRARAPEIVRLRARGQEARSKELARMGARLRDLSPAQMTAVEELTERIVNKLLHGPTVALRESSSIRIRPITSMSSRRGFEAMAASA